MKVQSFKRLNTVDFSVEEKKLVDKLSNSLNISIEELIQLANNRIDFTDNFKSVVRQVIVQVGEDGVPQGNVSIGFAGVLTNPIGTQVIRAQNQTNPAVYPTSGVGLTFNQNTATTIQVLHITGLVPGNIWNLTVVVF